MSVLGGYLGPHLTGITRAALPAWTPRLLFAAGEQGAWYDPSDFSTLFQDSAGTTPVTAVGQPVGLMLDKSGRGNHATQATTTSRPLLQQDSGGRCYLSFDGVDDGLATGNINFTGTDKVTVFTGLRKLSDAAIGTIVELTVSGDATNGGFWMRGPSGASTSNYQTESRGSLAAFSTYSPPFPAPVTNILTMQGVISTDTNTLRVDGIQSASASADQGTGTYANAPIYIGRRAGASLPFNGRLYGLILRGATSTADQIARAEVYLAIRSGVTL